MKIPRDQKGKPIVAGVFSVRHKETKDRLIVDEVEERHRAEDALGAPPARVADDSCGVAEEAWYSRYVVATT